jgi:hypothetical protein
MIAFIFSCLTSRRGLLSNPVDKMTQESFSKYMFSDLPCEYHVYIIGDSECYETACDYFGKERVKGFVNAENHRVEYKQYYVMHPWISPENMRAFPQGNFNNCCMFYKLNIARELIEQSGTDYKCIVQLRSDYILCGEYQKQIRTIIDNNDVKFFSTWGTLNFGKPDIMKNFMNIHNLPNVYQFNPKKYESTKTTAIMPYSKFILWLKDPNINKDAAELVMSMNILEYSCGTGIFMSGQDFIIKRANDEDDIIHEELKHSTQEELDMCKFI